MFTELEIPAGRRPLSRGEQTGATFMCLVFTGFMAAALLEDYEPKKLGPIFFILFWAPLLVLHELGHAVAAWAVGWRVRKIVIGVGPRLWRRRIGETDVTVNLAPISGFIIPGPTSRKGYRAKSAFVYAAGPGSEFLLLGGLLACFGTEGVFGQSGGIPGIALKSLAWAILIGGGFNLIPLAINGSATDGLGICLSPFLQDRQIEAHLVGWDCERIDRLLDAGRIDEAARLWREMKARHPRNPRLLLQEAQLIAETEGPDAAGRRLEELASSEIPRPAQDDGWLADLWLTRAQLELRCAEPNSLVVDRALHKAEEHGVSPLEWMIVKGAGMIERGLFESGGELLAKAFRGMGEGDPRADGTIFAWLAIASKQAGEMAAVERYRRAMELGQAPRWLREKATRELGAS